MLAALITPTNLRKFGYHFLRVKERLASCIQKYLYHTSVRKKCISNYYFLKRKCKYHTNNMPHLELGQHSSAGLEKHQPLAMTSRDISDWEN